ncbi:MAG: HAD-IA family hydrolase [Alphaproteobacteria bacterium]|nr:HAD-IA family hydrolase [Alphaproteobacteria bacterium]
MKKQALILDFGGVITKTLFETHRDTERVLGLAPYTLTWQGPFAPESDALWQDMCADKITERDYWHIRAKETGLLIGKDWQHMQDFVLAARGNANPIDFIRPEFLVTLAKVKQASQASIATAILSNELDLFYGKDFKKTLPFINDFDSIIDATYTKILKPDPRSYQAVLNALNLKAEQTIFVDDQWRNIAGAQNIGMQTVHFDVMQPQASYHQTLKLLAIE